MLIQAQPLQRLLERMLINVGAEAPHARICAGHLVTANLKGHDSHGVGMVPSYIRSIEQGKTLPNEHIKIVRDKGAVMLIDGGYGLGQVIGKESTDLAITRAKELGIACVGLRNACHIGRIGTYGEQCADAGLISIHFVNVVGHEPSVVPYGGKEPRMITNPFCCVVPRADGNHIALDMATSSIAIGKVRVAFMKGAQVPEHSLVDADGLPTNDPASFFTANPKGSLLPFGLHKGSGLMLMCELLGGGLAAKWTMQPGGERDYGATVNNMLSIVIDPESFGDVEKFESEVTAMIDYVRGTPPANGFDKVRVPGDPERETMAERLRDGIDIDDNSWQAIINAARKVNISDADITELTG